VILLDTNVLSAMMPREDEPAVIAWFNAQPPESVWTSTVTVFEVRVGLELMAKGRRRGRLRNTRHFAGLDIALVDPWRA
jgi:hypothetical protein